jgi:glycosyltransferase involved in cell wall biosynthesis
VKTTQADKTVRQDSIILREEVHSSIKAIGEADILIGIPSFNNARTIGHVVRAVHAGLSKYFPDKKSVLVNSDGGSQDGTMHIVENTSADLDSILLSHRVGRFHKITTSYQGIPGKGSAFRTIFEIAKALNVQACAVVDSDLRSISPEWIDLLIRPVLHYNYDYVSPYYQRHKYDGTITNSIVYPLTRALYGKAVRQPIGGDFGFSGRLASFFIEKDVWNSDVARFGIDIWMTTTAVVNGFRVCQSFLGAKIHDAKDPGADLSSMLAQVMSSIFSLVDEYEGVWSRVDHPEPVRTFGFVYTVGLEPVEIKLKGLIEKFRLGVKELLPIYKTLLSGDVLHMLTHMADSTDTGMFFPDKTWARIIYEYALAYHRKTMSIEHLLKSLTPLYLGKVASFVIEMESSTAEKVENRLEELCIAFETEKKYLVEMWKDSDTPCSEKSRSDVAEECIVAHR